MFRNARVNGRYLYAIYSFKCMCANVRRTNGLMFSTTRALRLVAFRGRSRHTSGFEPFETFELPPCELLTSATIDSEAEDSLRRDESVHFRSTGGSDVFQWVESPLGDAGLAAAAARCVLLHGLFEVWGHGRTQEEAAADAVRSGRIPQSCVDASWSLGVTSYGRSNLSKEQEKTIAGGPVNDFLSMSLKGRRMVSSASDIAVRIIEDTCPPPARNLPPYVRKRAGARCVRMESRFYICRELQVGAAVGGGTVMQTTCRRPVRGVLGTLALNSRSCRGPTAIEPEVALVMANLAKVRQGSRVLDPFCGSCSLLLPAANMGAKTWGADVAGPASVASTVEKSAVATNDSGEGGGRERGHGGSDGTEALRADRKGLEGIYEDFRALGLTFPELVKGDIADEASGVRRPEFYDAIITDPPYNIKEDAVVTNTVHRKNAPGATLAGHAEVSCSAATPVHLDGGSQQRERCDVLGSADLIPVWETGAGATAVACANDLVGEVIWSLLSLARYSLKPDGRLCFSSSSR